jgi:hypothetical protein
MLKYSSPCQRPRSRVFVTEIDDIYPEGMQQGWLSPMKVL